ncbi:hypothetical protein Zmor_011153 [Zophobas morio]|uniref:Uncharacterized protein n=1 Tax=Zophobas morio TaxID=2755281 RepID=A0AA38IR42_9CUCU|nr:hypothetical protein Zmor_011153 [Zophobas morio]
MCTWFTSYERLIALEGCSFAKLLENNLLPILVLSLSYLAMRQNLVTTAMLTHIICSYTTTHTNTGQQNYRTLFLSRTLEWRKLFEFFEQILRTRVRKFSPSDLATFLVPASTERLRTIIIEFIDS